MDSLESARAPQSSPSPVGFENAVTLARSARSELREWAGVADREGRLCVEGMAALERVGLIGFFVPGEYGGPGGTVAEFADVAGELGQGCLSTAMNWSMHAHQVCVLADHGGAMAASVLGRIAEERAWLASVTSEAETGGALLEIEAALEEEAGGVRVRRSGTYVSYGEHATFFAVTMRCSRESSTHDVRLVLLERGDGEIRATGAWHAMGLRGTASLPMSFDVLVDPERVLPAGMAEIAARTMTPLAHVGWSAAWLGAARGELRRFVAELPGTSSDRVLHRLGQLRLSLDLGDSLLRRVAADLDTLRGAGAPTRAFEEPEFLLRIHGLKVAGARIAFEVVDGLVQLAGLRRGYLRGEGSELERVFRDLRAASLMLGDDGLLVRNGRIVLTEGKGLARPR